MLFESAILAIIIFLGILSGYFLCLIAPEEIKPGYKYLIIMQNIVFAIFISVLAVFILRKFIILLDFSFFSVQSQLFVLSFLMPTAAGVLFGAIAFMLIKKKNVVLGLYKFTGIPLFFIFSYADFLIVLSSLLFIMGMPIATAQAYDYVRESKKNSLTDYRIIKKKDLFKELMIKHAWFIPIAILPFFFSYF